MYRTPGLQVPGEEVVFDEHVAHPVLEGLTLGLLLGGEFPVGVQVEGELGQDAEFTLYLYPAGGVHKGPGVVPEI